MAEPSTPHCGTCAGAREGPCPACGGTGKPGPRPRRRVPPYAPRPLRCSDYPDCQHWACHEEPDSERDGPWPEPTWLADDADAAHNLERGRP